MNNIEAYDNHEDCRLAALHRYSVLATEADSIFDSITTAAATACKTPVSLIALVDRDRHWFKSSIGIESFDLPIHIEFCAQAILNPTKLFEIEDISQNKCLRDNAVEAGLPLTKFFAAMPLTTPDGYAIGALCVIGNEPKVLTCSQRSELIKLAKLVIYLLEANSNYPNSPIGGALESKRTGGVVITDQSNVAQPIVFCNNGFERMTGYCASDFLGRNFCFLQSNHDRNESRIVIATVISNRETITLIQKSYHKDGTEFWNEVTFSPIVNSADVLVYYVGLMSDVSASVNSQTALDAGHEKLRISLKINAEINCKLVDSNIALQKEIARRLNSDQQTRKLQEELIHIARVTTMGEMATGLAHELNQPLLAATLSADTALMIARDYATTDKELMDCLTDIRSEMLRAGEIIHTLRQSVSRNSSERASLDINNLVQQTVNLFRTDTQPHNVQINIIEGALPCIVADRVQIAQVLVNLIRNSLDAMPLGEGREGNIVDIATTCVDDGINVSVTDNGPGFDLDIIPFKAYETNKKSGLGIGLSICRSIIESHNGKIWVDNTLSTSCRVQFTLPSN